MLKYNSDINSEKECMSMKKTLKTIVCVFLLGALTLSFSGCGNKEKNESKTVISEEKKPSDSHKNNRKPKTEKSTSSEKAESKENIEAQNKKLASEAAESFMKAAISLDAAKASAYCVDAASIESVMPFDDIKEQVTRVAYGDMTDEEINNLKPMLGPIVDAYATGVTGTLSYKITDVKKDGNGYVATAEIESISSERAMEILSTTMSEEAIGNMGEGVADELAESGAITADSTPEEIMQAMFDAISKKMIAQVEDEIKTSGREKKTAVIYITEEKGRMLVDLSKSTFPDTGFIKE